MRIVHPKTGHAMVMVEGCELIAEIEKDKGEDDRCYWAVTIGCIGSSSAMMLYRDEWDGFMALIQQIDLEFRHDMGAMGDLKP